MATNNKKGTTNRHGSSCSPFADTGGINIAPNAQVWKRAQLIARETAEMTCGKRPPPWFSPLQNQIGEEIAGEGYRQRHELGVTENRTRRYSGRNSWWIGWGAGWITYLARGARSRCSGVGPHEATLVPEVTADSLGTDTHFSSFLSDSPMGVDVSSASTHVLVVARLEVELAMAPVPTARGFLAAYKREKQPDLEPGRMGNGRARHEPPCQPFGALFSLRAASFTFPHADRSKLVRP